MRRSGALLHTLPDTVPGLAKARARQCLRAGDASAAVSLIDAALAADRTDMSAWALAELAWRATGDCRHKWLLPDRLWDCLTLELAEDERAVIAASLHKIHDTRWAPIGQSVRSGTQTRGDLRDRDEPSIDLLFARLAQSVSSFLQGLPPLDPAHPLDRLQRQLWDFTATWSIRLRSSGHHVSHVHPGGLLSSACYFEVPEGLTDNAGALELGRPPTDVALPLKPIATIAPKPGRLALFPSFLYHGTRPFADECRLSVAFDISSTTA